MSERETDWLEGNDARTQQERQREMSDTSTPPPPPPGWRGSAYSHPFAADLARERDALAARLAAVEALADEWDAENRRLRIGVNPWATRLRAALRADSSEAPA
jgi:hypothetical protein